MSLAGRTHPCGLVFDFFGGVAAADRFIIRAQG
jgi:hypothetical protein